MPMLQFHSEKVNDAFLLLCFQILPWTFFFLGGGIQSEVNFYPVYVVYPSQLFILLMSLSGLYTDISKMKGLPR